MGKIHNNRHLEQIRGLLSQEPIVEFLKDLRLRNFEKSDKNIRQSVGEFYNKLFQFLVLSCDDVVTFIAALDDIQGGVFDSEPGWKLIQKANDFYYKEIKGRYEFSTAEPYIKGRTILEFGCGGSILGLFCKEKGYNVLTTDVLDWRIPQAKHLTFVQMKNPCKIPFSDKCVDTALVQFVLHHINSKNLVSVLSELSRVCSRIIIREDVYDVPRDRQDFRDIYNRDELLNIFSHFSQNQQLSFLILWDYWVNSIENKIFNMNYPFEFKTIAQWETLFRDARLKQVDTQVVGFYRTRGFYGTNHAIFALDS